MTGQAVRVMSDDTNDRSGPVERAFAQAPIGAVRAAVRRALDEDLTPIGDITAMLLPDGASATARLVSRADGVLAGSATVTETYAQLDAEVRIEWRAADGAELAPGTVIAEITGPLASVLTGERTALNFLGHLSGVATRARRFVDILAAAGDDHLKVWDTRKTTPGLRALEKAAVRAGGAQNHRGNLSEWVMFKDNHLTLLGIVEAVAVAHEQWPGRLVQVECDRFDQLVEALDAGADAVLLDNMSPDEVRTCVAEIDRRFPRAAAGMSAPAGTSGRGRPLVEISGGIDAESLPAYAGCGADRVSIGAITNSAPVLDIGLDIDIDLDAGSTDEVAR